MFDNDLHVAFVSRYLQQISWNHFIVALSLCAPLCVCCCCVVVLIKCKFLRRIRNVHVISFQTGNWISIFGIGARTFTFRNKAKSHVAHFRGIKQKLCKWSELLSPCVTNNYCTTCWSLLWVVEVFKWEIFSWIIWNNCMINFHLFKTSYESWTEQFSCFK